MPTAEYFLHFREYKYKNVTVGHADSSNVCGVHAMDMGCCVVGLFGVGGVPVQSAHSGIERE